MVQLLTEPSFADSKSQCSMVEKFSIAKLQLYESDRVLFNLHLRGRIKRQLQSKEYNLNAFTSTSSAAYKVQPVHEFQDNHFITLFKSLFQGCSSYKDNCTIAQYLKEEMNLERTEPFLIEGEQETYVQLRHAYYLKKSNGLPIPGDWHKQSQKYTISMD